MLKTELDCVRCDRFELPEGFVAYKRTPEFNEDSIPQGLQRHHSTKPGVWALIHVLSGQLKYYLDGLEGRERTLDPENVGIILPEVLHHVATDGPVRFYIEFYCRPSI